MVLVTFVLTLPAIALPTRGWLKLSGYLIVINLIFTVVLGLYLWISTLRTKERFSPIWNVQPAQVQDLMQSSVCNCLRTPTRICAFVCYTSTWLILPADVVTSSLAAAI